MGDHMGNVHDAMDKKLDELGGQVDDKTRTTLHQLLDRAYTVGYNVGTGTGTQPA